MIHKEINNKRKAEKLQKCRMKQHTLKQPMGQRKNQKVN